MFKSIFSKYLAIFMILITASFVILALIISSIANDYAVSTKEDGIERTAHAVCGFLTRTYDGETADAFADTVRENAETVRSVITASVFYSDSFVFVTDIHGNIVSTDLKATQGVLNGSLPASCLSRLEAGEEFREISDLGGMLQTKHLICAEPVTTNGGVWIGNVIVCAESQNITEFVNVMIRAIILSTALLMLAVLIAFTFITDRILIPLKSTIKAVKSFSVGKYDARVPVTGNDEFTELAAAFNQMAESIENQENLRRTFLANVSHDLRTPMTTIGGFVDGIRDGVIPEEKRDYYLEIVSNEVKRLSRLVSTLLDISRIQAGERKFTSTTFDICEMAREILISFEQKIEAKTLNVSFDAEKDNMNVSADKDAIYQILYNICDNAIKFAYPGGAYRIHIRTSQKKTLISVFNEGTGIPQEDLPFIFDRFYKSDKSRGLDKTGVGLGLYIAKTIIDAHGEQIYVTSEFEKNCEFTFTLPTAK